MIKKFLVFIILFANLFSSDSSNIDLKNLLSKFVEIDENDQLILPKEYKYIMMDIGLSFNAPQSQVWLENTDASIVLAFEPARVNWERINIGCPPIPKWFARNVIPHNHPIRKKSKISIHRNKRFFPFNIALGNSNQTSTTFYETQNDSGCSSIYEPRFFPHSTYSVPLIRLERFFDFFPFKDYPLIDYIKIDAQGADLDIIKGMGNYLNERVICVTAEPENNQYKGTFNSQEELTRYLEIQGFIKIKNARVDDPTFVNKRFYQLYFDKKIDQIIFQQG